MTTIPFLLVSEAPRFRAGHLGEAKRNFAEANPAIRPPRLGLLPGTLQSRVAIPSRASARGILAKASKESKCKFFKAKAGISHA